MGMQKELLASIKRYPGHPLVWYGTYMGVSDHRARKSLAVLVSRGLVHRTGVTRNARWYPA